MNSLYTLYRVAVHKLMLINLAVLNRFLHNTRISWKLNKNAHGILSSGDFCTKNTLTVYCTKIYGFYMY